MSAGPVRLIDTGTHVGRWNIAADQVLIESHRAGATPDTLRLLRFSPSALVGRHQDLSREIDLDYCTAQDIDVGRRVTGGGALYLDSGQLGWELICNRRRLGGGSLESITRHVCEAAARALRRLGVAVSFRPRNDLEVDGKKIGGTGGFFDGETVFYQGTLLIDTDTDVMFHVLRLPAAKRARHARRAAAERVTSLRAALGDAMPEPAVLAETLSFGLARELDLELERGALSKQELRDIEQCFEHDIGSSDFVREVDGVSDASGWRHEFADTPGGLLEVHLRVTPRTPRAVETVIITGDYFVTPPRAILDLEAALRGVREPDIIQCVKDFFARSAIDTLSFSPEELGRLIARALGSN